MGSLEPIQNDDFEAMNMQSTMTLLDPEEFRRQGHMIIDFIAQYYQNIEKHKVLSQVEPGYLRKILPSSAPYNPERIETILQDVEQHIVPGITHWQSPNYFAYFPSSHSIGGFLGEMLSAGFSVVGFNWVSSPAATELESIVMDWLGQMLELPESFLFSGKGGGVIHSTTCEAILCTLIAARDKMLTKIGRDNADKLVVYCSDQTHCSLQKAAGIAGIHPENFRAIETTKSTCYALCPVWLRRAILEDIERGLIPLYLCATIGTTSTTAVDPLRPLCEVANEFRIWVHVDAAYAGSVCICPEFRHFIDGVELASSFSLNAHKWLFTPLDCCCVWLKDPRALTSSLSTNPEYLRNKASKTDQVVDYKDWQITLSRRFRAMKLWLVLRCYGVANLRRFLRSHVDMARKFEGLVTMDERFEIVVPRNFSMVCFRISPSATSRTMASYDDTKSTNGNIHNENDPREIEGSGADPSDTEKKGFTNGLKSPNDTMITFQASLGAIVNEVNKKLLESINASGEIYMTHAFVGGVYMIRFAIGASLTQELHVIRAWNIVQHHANAILGF